MLKLCVCVCVLMVSVLSFGREFLEFARLGVATNWFGLGCPIHWGQPTWFTLGLTFLLGLSLGALATATTCIFLFLRLRHWTLGTSRSTTAPTSGHPSDLALDRLRGYLHG